jgi:hypothetical protein
VIVTAHQPNFLPGLNVTEKIRSADAVIWLDEVQYSHGGWTNRNRMPDGSWLTVPVDRSTDMAPINRVRIRDHGAWRRKLCFALDQHYGDRAHPYIAQIARPYGLLIGLNLACLRQILNGCQTEWHFQSHLDGGRAVTAVSDDREELAPISERLAMMTAEIGGTVYVSGPSGRNYLDETPFHERGIAVAYYRHVGPTACSIVRPYTYLLDRGVYA